jgi:hypothetical protein
MFILAIFIWLGSLLTPDKEMVSKMLPAGLRLNVTIIKAEWVNIFGSVYCISFNINQLYFLATPFLLIMLDPDYAVKEEW